MIILLSKVKIIDNSGGVIGRCIKILRPAGRKYAGLGDMILVSVIKSLPSAGIKSGDVHKAIVVRTKYSSHNSNWGENAVALVKITSKKLTDYTPVGTRIKGPISYHIKFVPGCLKLFSLANSAY
jgi:large subunit ribosomal protein L14